MNGSWNMLAETDNYICLASKQIVNLYVCTIYLELSYNCDLSLATDSS